MHFLYKFIRRLITSKAMASGSESEYSDCDETSHQLSPLECLQIAVADKLVKGAFSAGQEFLPNRDIAQLTTQETVREILPSASKELVDFICNGASRIFLTLCHSIAEQKLMKYINWFFASNLTDASLPIDSMIFKDGRCKRNLRKQPSGRESGKRQAECKHDAALKPFHRWGEHERKSFFKEQHCFTSPSFMRSDLKQCLLEGSILPITWISSTAKDGHFSCVHEAKLRGDHQDHFTMVRGWHDYLLITS